MNPELLELLGAVTVEEEQLLQGRRLDSALYFAGETQVVAQGKMLPPNQLITVRPHTRFVEFPAHRHDYVEIIYMCAGQTKHTIDGETPLTLETGDLLMLNQHAGHAIAKAGQGDIGVNFIVLPPFFDTAREMVGTGNALARFLMGSLQQHGGEAHYLHYRVAGLPAVQNLLENLLWGLLRPQAHGNRINRITMGLLFLQLLNHTDRLDVPPAGRAGHALVVACLREIDEHYITASLSGIAERYAVSVTYLSTLVKKAMGKTFKELLQQKRLAKAAQLLRDTGLPTGEVISAVGYENSSYFYRIFKNQYGMVPKEYRKTAIE